MAVARTIPRAMPEVRRVHRLPEVLDPLWVLADQQLGEVRHGAYHGRVCHIERGLSPADEARIVRGHLDEHPVALRALQTRVSTLVIFIQESPW